MFVRLHILATRAKHGTSAPNRSGCTTHLLCDGPDIWDKISPCLSFFIIPLRVYETHRHSASWLLAFRFGEPFAG